MPTSPFQSSLFEEGEIRAVSVATAMPRGKPADRRQATFQKLIRQIETERASLEGWRTYQIRYAQRVNEELMPLQAHVRTLRISLVHLLDAQYQHPGVLKGRHQRQRLRAMIVDLAESLLAEGGDPELIALHDRHSDMSHAEQALIERDLSRLMIEQIFNVELDQGDEEADMGAMFTEALHKAEQKEQAREKRRAARRKSARSAAAEAQRAEAEKQVSQSVREVYRKLASALHPDRTSADFTPERKTELMQRVNRAYDAGDLLELLNVQLEIEQIDAEHLSNLTAQRLDHYNAVLRGQLAELKAELESLVAPFRALVPFAHKLGYKDVDRSVDQEVASMKIEAQRLADDLESLHDPKRLAEAVKHYRSPGNGQDRLDEMAMLGALLDGLGPARPRRR